MRQSGVASFVQRMGLAIGVGNAVTADTEILCHMLP